MSESKTGEDDPFDMEKFRARGIDLEKIIDQAQARQASRMPRKIQRAFVRPCPVAWLRTAVGLPGKALAVAIACWYVAGKANSKTVQVTPGIRDELGIQRKAFYNGLEALERAGLLSVDGHQGRSAIVTILLPQGPGNEGGPT